MATYANGFGGSVTVASYTFCVESWSLNGNAEALDTTTTCDSGWETNILGAKSWDGSCKSFWDTASVPTGATAGLTIGARATFVFAVGSSGKSFTGTAQITKITTENPVKGVVSFSLDFKGSGALTSPS